MKIYVMGNLLVQVDSLPVRLIPKLQKSYPDIEFIEIDPSEDFPKSDELIIIDTAINAQDVILLDDINKIELGSIVSLHDFDLGYNLKLMKKFGLVNKVKIICVPPSIPEAKALKGISKLITNIREFQ